MADVGRSCRRHKQAEAALHVREVCNVESVSCILLLHIIAYCLIDLIAYSLHTV